MDTKIYRCIGRIAASQYETQRGFAYTKRFDVLKSKSTLRVDDFIGDISEILPINFFDVDDGLYELTVVNESRDWETGIVDDWDVQLIPIEGDTND